jgi:hypothetical protein
MEILQSPEGKQAIQTYGLGAQMDENIRFISEMRPIDFALNILTINIISGIMLGIPIAAITQRTIAKSDSLNSQR